MTRLDDALHTLGLPGTSELEGTWVTLAGERCRVYVMGTRWGQRYYTWCDDPHDRTVEMYADPIAAVQAGLRRAARSAALAGREGAQDIAGFRALDRATDGVVDVTDNLVIGGGHPVLD